MNENEWVFLSYHNRNAQEALTTAQGLLAYGYSLWVDRFQIAPNSDWESSILAMQNQAQKALVLLSQDYLDSEYCVEELAVLETNQAKIIAVCLDVSALTGAAESNFFARIDCTSHQQETALAEICAKLDGLECFAAPVSNEHDYLYQLISRLELEFLNSPTARIACLNSKGIEAGSRKLRPRCHVPEIWFSHGHYDLYETEASLAHANHLVLDNILEWFAWRSRMVIIGESGTGKTSLLRYLCLISAFRRLKDAVDVPLPYYCELDEWTGKQSLSQYLRNGWPLDSELELLLPRGAVMLFVDGLGEDTELEKRASKELETLFDKNSYPALVICAREESLNIDFPSDMAFVQITALQEQQAALLMESLALKLALSSTPQKLENLVINALAQTIGADDASSLWEQNCAYIIPALWQQLKPESSKRFTSTDLLNALEALVFSTIETPQASTYTYTLALAAMGNDLLIQLALKLGILKAYGQGFRFVINALPLYLAAKRLLNDGIYQHLRHPRFDNAGERIPQAWDTAVFFAVRLLSADDVELAIQTISDIDPYLAIRVAQAQPSVSTASLRDILNKLLESSHSHLRSMPLSIRCMNAIGSKEIVLSVLVETLQNGTQARRLKALEFLIMLELPVDQNFLSAMAGIELDFPDSAYSVLDSCDSPHLLAQLARVLLVGDEPLRLRAVYTLGEYAHPVGAFLISQLQVQENLELLRTAINALCKIGGKDAVAFFYQMLLHPEAEIYQTAAKKLSAVDASTKSRLSIFLAREQALNPALLEAIQACSELQVSRILAYILGNLGYGLSHSIDLERLSDGSSDMVKRLLDLLSSKMASLSSREDFQDFADKTLNQMDKEQAEDLRREKGVSALAQRVRPSHIERKQETVPSGKAIPQALIDALQHSDWLLRLNAVEEIAEYAPELSLNYLLTAAGDSDAQVRMAALNKMPSARDYPPVLTALLKALDDEDNQVIDAVAERFRRTGEAPVSELVAKLQGSSEYSLAVIIDLLGELGDEMAVSSLASFIDDVREPWMWNHCIGDIAVQALIRIGSPEALQIVKESGRIAYPVFKDIILPGSDDEFGREPSHLELFTALLNDLRSDNWQQSQQAARKMRSIAQELKDKDNESLASNLLEFLADPNWVVRWTLVESLAWLHAASAVPALLQTLNDENWMVQIASIRALVELKSRESSRQIAALLLSKNNTVREAAAEALGELANPESVKVLALALKDSDQFVRLAVVRAIIAINVPSQADTLLDALTDDYSHVRWYAIRAIAQAANPQHLRAVVPLLRDKSKPEWEKYSISNYAELALQRMASPGSKKVLEKWLQVKHLQK